MANVLYNKIRETLLNGDLNWLEDSIRAVLVDTGAYTFAETHQFLTSIPQPSIVATSGPMTNKTTTDGAADAADVTFANVTGPSVEAVVLFKDTGSAATSNLIAYIDTATGLPITPNGGDITITWDNGANKIFKL